ncbi:hypothetical protein [Thalassotalea sp. G2M2-11]|uniref:hypothetical protein n=1 Tax=Thalassotalea sp. G2M2-11 TaxID=2787627 RepID=UPI0019D12964|nr:hypothetical protein [Thalassotalea sp. G2M2-11]
MKNSQSTIKKLTITLLAALSTVFSLVSNAENFDIPALDDAKLFAQYTDELPAVINYFTQQNEQAIIEFYQQHFGEAISNEMKRGRLTLHFNTKNGDLRVVISQQGKRYQVDALLK